MDYIQMYPLGRLGNQMFEYAFLKAYSEKNGLQLQVPHCVLRDVFEIAEGVPEIQSSLIEEGRFQFGMKNIMPKDYFQDKKYTDYYDRNYCKKMFKFRNTPVGDSKEVVAHIRHGDFFRHRRTHAIVSIPSFERAFEKYHIDPKKVTWLREEDRRPIVDDFICMMKAKTLFRSNSTFALWAHVLADDSQKCYSPIIHGAGYMECEFAEGGDQAVIRGGDMFAFAK